MAAMRKRGLFVLFLISLFIFSGTALADVKITSPSDGATVGGIVPVTVEYSGTQDMPVIYISSNIFGRRDLDPPELSGSYTYDWDTTFTPNGTEKGIYVSAWMAGSPNGASDIIWVNVYNPLPVITITSPPDGAYVSPETTNLSVTVEYHNVSPNYRGIQWISLTTSGGHVLGKSLPDAPTSGTYTWDLDIGSYLLGPHWIMAYCSDNVVGSSYTRINFTKDNPPAPKVDLTKTPDKTKISTVGEPINVANGNMFTSATDISMSALEIPLELSRIYNSQDNFSGQFGYGWRSNFDIRLEEYPDSSVVEVDEQGVYTVYTKNPDGSYAPSAGKYSFLTKNIDSSFTIQRKYGQKLYFDTLDRLIKIEGQNGNAINITRESSGAISEVADPSGRKLLFINDAQGRAVEIKDPTGRSFKYEYDAAGNLIKTIDPLNNQTVYSYDVTHNLTQVIDANNNSLYFEYDANDRANHSWQDNNNNEVTLVFDADNKTTITTDSRGNSTKYGYNDYGLVTKITDAKGNTQITNWGANLNKLSFTDENAHTASYSYDNRGNLLTTTDPLGNLTNFTYTQDFDLVKTATDAQGNITTYDYDAKGNLVKFTDALGNFTVNTYDSVGQFIATTNPKGDTIAFTYDNYNNLASIADALGNTTLFAYDIVGNRTQITDAKNNLTQFTYNELNQLIKITYPDGSINSFTYDALDNKISSTDNTLNTTAYTYDLNNQLISIINPLGKTITFEYDSEGNRAKVIDQNQRQTSYQYDSLNRFITETNPLGLIKSYEYDPAGNRTSMSDANGNTVYYIYDALNRLTEKGLSPKGTVPDSEILFVYDSLGRRIAMTDSQGTTNYTYDKLSRLIQVDGPNQNDTMQYAYDALGNRTNLVLPDGKTITYTYDALNRMISITDPESKTTTYAYDELGNPLDITYPNNIRTTYVFDALRRLTRLTNQNQITQEKLSEFGYTYDLAGRRTRIDSLDAVTDYAYDAIGELTAEIKSSTTNPYQINYEYDPAGNRLHMLKNNTEYLYAYNNANQLIQEDITGPALTPITVTGTVSDTNGIKAISVNGINAALNGSNFSCQVNLSSGVNTISVTATDNAGNTVTKTLSVIYNQTEQILYLYDNNGNLIKKQSATKELNLSYDYENRLAQGLSFPQGSIPDFRYDYDGEGRRIQSIIGTNTINYLYDGLDVVLERNGSGDPVASYLRNPYAAGGIGGIISSKGLSPETYYTYDGLGSVVNLSDVSGVNLQSYSYDAFGNEQGHSPAGTDPNNRQFLTKELDSSGLIYFGARYYDPTIGRFITQDPTGMSDGPNMYMYSRNDPVNAVDLWGLDTYYINYELFELDPEPTNKSLSHSYVATTNNGVVTNTYSWGNNWQNRWFRNDRIDIATAQRAIDSNMGVERYGGEELDYFINVAFMRKDPRRPYDPLFNNCKENAADLIREAKRLQKIDEQRRRKKCLKK